MIIPDENIKPKIITNEKYTQIFTYERLVIKPLETKTISLPYKKNCSKAAICELDRSLVNEGLIIMWSNINEAENGKYLEFIIKNTCFDKDELFGYFDTPLNKIIGSKSKIDIRPNTEFVKIYTI